MGLLCPNLSIEGKHLSLLANVLRVESSAKQTDAERETITSAVNDVLSQTLKISPVDFARIDIFIVATTKFPEMRCVREFRNLRKQSRGLSFGII